jgi:hypothetical protein
MVRVRPPRDTNPDHPDQEVGLCVETLEEDKLLITAPPPYVYLIFSPHTRCESPVCVGARALCARDGARASSRRPSSCRCDSQRAGDSIKRLCRNHLQEGRRWS